MIGASLAAVAHVGQVDAAPQHIGRHKHIGSLPHRVRIWMGPD